MIDTKALRQKILDLAIRGKLVEQDPNNEPASLLIARIKAEKEQLIKEKKIKKEKPLPPIKADEIPFQIPNGWEWVRLGDIIQLVSGQDFNSSLYFDEPHEHSVPYITGASNIENNRVIINRWTDTPKSIAIKDDLLIVCKGSVGKTAYLEEEKAHIARQIMAVRMIYGLDRFYIGTAIHAKVDDIVRSQKGIIPGIERSTMLNLAISLPPIKEQKRIVAKIEELFAQVDAIEKAQNDLVELKKIAKQKVLDLAIRGKLVEQDPNNEPASLLIARIK
ncbi:restriction endonuclease subunit S, partial [Dubosiella newyorkensis]